MDAPKPPGLEFSIDEQRLSPHARAGRLEPGKVWNRTLEQEAPRLVPLDPAKFPSLEILAQELFLFTPALLFRFGGFPCSLLTDFGNEQNRDIPFFTLVFTKPLFAGLQTLAGDTSWNFTLFALDQEEAKGFTDFIGGLTVVDQAQQWLSKCGVQDLKIKDPLVEEGEVEIVALGVDGNRGKLCLNWWAYPHDLPFPTWLPARPSTLAEARHIFGG